jgi:hypothetical protein
LRGQAFSLPARCVTQDTQLLLAIILSGYSVTKKLDLYQHMTHIACGYFFGSGIQNDVVSKDVGFLRNHGFHLRINYLVPFKRPQTHPPAQRFLVGSTWPMSFPVALLISLF